MPTKVASYLTELGFKELDHTTQAANYNKDSAGQYIVVKDLNRMYRYEPNSERESDGIRVLDSSVSTAKWVSVGGSAMSQERVTGAFDTAGSSFTFNRVITHENEILYVNVGNTQVLRSQYTITIGVSGTTITLNETTVPSGTNWEVMLFTGNVEGSNDIDYSLLPATLYQKMMEVSGNTIALNNSYTIYKKTVSNAVTLNFTKPDGYTSDWGIVTFELYIDMTIASTILWTPTISWNGGTAPLFNAVKKYLLSFRTFDGGTTWIGNLEMEW